MTVVEFVAMLAMLAVLCAALLPWFTHAREGHSGAGRRVLTSPAGSPTPTKVVPLRRA